MRSAGSGGDSTVSKLLLQIQSWLSTQDYHYKQHIAQQEPLKTCTIAPHSSCTLLCLTRPKHTRQDETSPCKGSSKDQPPGVGMEHGDQGTEAAGAAQVLDVAGGGHEGMQEVGAVAVQHPLQPHQPLSLPDMLTDMHCNVNQKIWMVPGLLLRHNALCPRFKVCAEIVLSLIYIIFSAKCRVRVMAQAGILGQASHDSPAIV